MIISFDVNICVIPDVYLFRIFSDPTVCAIPFARSGGYQSNYTRFDASRPCKITGRREKTSSGRQKRLV
jgi:hypothetical protein